MWEGTTDHSAHGLLAGPSADDSDDRKGIDAWLTQLLANGSVKATEVYSAADAAGYSKDQAKRAKRRLAIEAVREAMDGPWFWRLDAKGADDQGSTPSHQTPLPSLPCTSEGVREAAESRREHDAAERSLRASETVGQAAPTPLTVRRQELNCRRTIRVRGKEVPRCYICGKGVMAGQGDAHLGCLSKQETA